jgi:hypothetical protein
MAGRPLLTTVAAAVTAMVAGRPVPPEAPEIDDAQVRRAGARNKLV